MTDGESQAGMAEALEEQNQAVEPADSDLSPSDDDEWFASLRQIMRDVVHGLPASTSIGELLGAMEGNPRMAPLMARITVKQLIEMAVSRPAEASTPTNGRGPDGEFEFDEDGNPVMVLEAPAVIRRRADVPDGDLRVLRCLAEKGPQSETALSRNTQLTSEQIRLILRALRTKGHVHIEGSGAKRKVKVTRNGSGYLRKQRRRR